MKFSTVFLTLGIIALISGCRSDAYYQEKAVEAARDYIFENARELTPEQYGFVKTTPPVFLCGQVLEPMKKNAIKGTVENSAIIQICITWQIPGARHDYLVFGLSDPRMTYWNPLRLIRRKVSRAPAALTDALNSSRTYAVSSLREQMSSKDINHIRFSHPMLIESKFSLNPSPSAEVPRPWSPTAAAPAAGDQAQYSLVWQLSGDRSAVFTGVGNKELTGWTIVFAGVISNAELRSMTVKKLRDPENYLFPEKTAAK